MFVCSYGRRGFYIFSLVAVLMFVAGLYFIRTALVMSAKFQSVEFEVFGKVQGRF